MQQIVYYFFFYILFFEKIFFSYPRSLSTRRCVDYLQQMTVYDFDASFIVDTAVWVVKSGINISLKKRKALEMLDFKGFLWLPE